MSCAHACPPSATDAIHALLRRYDGPPPADDLFAALVEGPADPLLWRALSRETDRAALGVLRSIAGLREHHAFAARSDGRSLEKLSLCLAAYRRLGWRLAEAAAAR
jgi:hypothetical protein